MNAHSDTKNPATVGLMVAGLTSLAIAVLLALIAVNQSTSLSLYGPDTALIAALNAWSNVLMLVAVVSLVGASVLAGVRWLLVAPTTAEGSAASSYQDADGL